MDWQIWLLAIGIGGMYLWLSHRQRRMIRRKR